MLADNAIDSCYPIRVQILHQRIVAEAMGVDHDHALTISAELLRSLSQTSDRSMQRAIVMQSLDDLLSHHDWSKSFVRPQAILFLEPFRAELLVYLHDWLRMRCADITNIFVICFSNLNAKQWWQEWCRVHHELSFSIKELFYTTPYSMTWEMNMKELRDSPIYTKCTTKKAVTHLFNYQGGRQGGQPSQYAVLKLLSCRFPAMIDFQGTFGNKSSLIDYVENQTYFCNQNEIDTISGAYDQYVDQDSRLNGRQTRPEEALDDAVNHDQMHCVLTRSAWHLDQDDFNRCWATIVRETIDDDPIASISEKTLKPFLYHSVVLPMGFQSVEYLEQHGFWFPHQIVDYSYQNEPIFSRRLDKLVKMLYALQTKFTMADLQQFYEINIASFHQNVINLRRLVEIGLDLARD